MNREIKFRAWDTLTKKMIFEGFHLFGEVLTFSALDQWCYENPNPDYSSSLLRCNDIIITQYTGLKDKNGKDIYEGDLLGEKVKIDGEEIMTAIPVLYSIEMAAFAVDLSFTKDGSLSELLSQNYEGMEIVGNIYENPELLHTGA